MRNWTSEKAHTGHPKVFWAFSLLLALAPLQTHAAQWVQTYTRDTKNETLTCPLIRRGQLIEVKVLEISDWIQNDLPGAQLQLNLGDPFFAYDKSANNLRFTGEYDLDKTFVLLQDKEVTKYGSYLVTERFRPFLLELIIRTGARQFSGHVDIKRESATSIVAEWKTIEDGDPIAKVRISHKTAPNGLEPIIEEKSLTQWLRAMTAPYAVRTRRDGFLKAIPPRVALRQLEEDSLPFLQRYFTNEVVKIQQYAIEYYARVANSHKAKKSAFAQFAKLLEHSKGYIRIAAADALAELCDKSSAEEMAEFQVWDLLLSTCKDKNPWVLTSIQNAIFSNQHKLAQLDSDRLTLLRSSAYAEWLKNPANQRVYTGLIFATIIQSESINEEHIQFLKTMLTKLTQSQSPRIDTLNHVLSILPELGVQLRRLTPELNKIKEHSTASVQYLAWLNLILSQQRERWSVFNQAIQKSQLQLRQSLCASLPFLDIKLTAKQNKELITLQLTTFEQTAFSDIETQQKYFILCDLATSLHHSKFSPNNQEQLKSLVHRLLQSQNTNAMGPLLKTALKDKSLQQLADLVVPLSELLLADNWPESIRVAACRALIKCGERGRLCLRDQLFKRQPDRVHKLLVHLIQHDLMHRRYRALKAWLLPCLAEFLESDTEYLRSAVGPYYQIIREHGVAHLISQLESPKWQTRVTVMNTMEMLPKKLWPEFIDCLEEELFHEHNLKLRKLIITKLRKFRAQRASISGDNS